MAVRPLTEKEDAARALEFGMVGIFIIEQRENRAGILIKRRHGPLRFQEKPMPTRFHVNRKPYRVSRAQEWAIQKVRKRASSSGCRCIPG